MFSPIFKCNHDFVYYFCTPKRRYCKKCQLSQVFIHTWVDSNSQKELDLEKIKNATDKVLHVKDSSKPAKTAKTANGSALSRCNKK